jgi:hypothetical protein
MVSAPIQHLTNAKYLGTHQISTNPDRSGFCGGFEVSWAPDLYDFEFMAMLCMFRYLREVGEETPHHEWACFTSHKELLILSRPRERH